MMEYWYAVRMDEDDDSTDFGSVDKNEAIQMAKECNAAYVSIIESDPHCDWYVEEVGRITIS